LRADPAGRFVVQTKVVLGLTGLLLMVGTLLLAMVEWEAALGGRAWTDKLGLAFFQAATPRTAGFNTVDLGLLSEPALFLMIVLMFIGGAPGSTAGGVKLTTIAIMWANLKAIGQGLPQARLLGKEVGPMAIRRAMLVLTGGLVVPTVGLFLLQLTEGRPLLITAFEAFSAMGTVGLSLGLTPQLSALGRIVVILLMFIGRLGPLTLAYGLMAWSRERQVRLPQARIMVG
jgi:trk system potassium uptake protein TrkH